MDEPIPGRNRPVGPLGCSRRAKKLVLPNEGFAAFLGPDHVLLDSRRGPRRRELDPNGARPFQDPQFISPEPVELFLDQGANARRHAPGKRIEISSQFPSFVAPGKDALGQPVVHQSDQEQWVPFGSLMK